MHLYAWCSILSLASSRNRTCNCNCTQNTKSPPPKFVSFRAAWGADDVRFVGNQHGPDPIPHSPCHFLPYPGLCNGVATPLSF